MLALFYFTSIEHSLLSWRIQGSGSVLTPGRVPCHTSGQMFLELSGGCAVSGGNLSPVCPESSPSHGVFDTYWKTLESSLNISDPFPTLTRVMFLLSDVSKEKLAFVKYILSESTRINT